MGNGVHDELIRKKDALDALMAERKHLLANGQKGAEHVLTHHGYNVIDELPPVQPILTCDGCRYDGYYKHMRCRNCIRKERDLYEPE